jgi:hypothetical protein
MRQRKDDMSIQPITPTNPACFGVCCTHHLDCERYARIESEPSAERIATCDDRAEGEYPLLVKRQPAEHE